MNKLDIKNPKPKATSNTTSMLGTAIILGAAFGWMEWFHGLGGLTICFYIVFWAAGRVVGQHYRKNDFSLVKIMSAFLASLFASTIGVAIVERGLNHDVLLALIPCAIDTSLVLLGFFMGKGGFGRKS